MTMKHLTPILASKYMKSQNLIPQSGHIASMLVLLAVLAVTPAPCHAGQLLVPVGFDSDANSGISSSKTYTVALDPGDANGVTINSVNFASLTTTSGTSASATVGGYTYTYSTSAGALRNTADQYSWGNYTATGEVQTLLGDLIFADAPGTSTLTLPSASLTLGKTYDARLYFRAWNANEVRNITIGFDEDGGGALGSSMSFNEENPVELGFSSTKQAFYIDYQYTATGTDLVVTLSCNTASPHFYGFTNEVTAVPEPSTWAMIAGGLGLLVFGQHHRRRSA